MDEDEGNGVGVTREIVDGPEGESEIDDIFWIFEALESGYILEGFSSKTVGVKVGVEVCSSNERINDILL